MVTLSTGKDKENEDRIIEKISAAWKCEVYRINAQFSPVDCYVVRDKRIYAYLELKYRKVAYEAYPTMFLPLRKWLNLRNAAMGTDSLGFFVWGFIDGRIFYINVNDVPVQKAVMAGRTDRGYENDLEPMFEVELKHLREIKMKWQQIFTEITTNYADAVVSERVNDAKPEFVWDWEGDFDDIHEAYEEQGRGEAESQVIQELISSHGGDSLSDDDKVALTDKLADHYGLSLN